MKTLLAVTLLLCLVACAAPPANINYYLLTPLNMEVEPTVQQSKRVKLVRFELADYLQQANLALYIGDNKIYYSPRDAWAEPLSLSVRKSLVNTLLAKHDILLVDNNAVGGQKLDGELVLSIDHFHASNEGMVYLDGSFDYRPAAGQSAMSSVIPFRLSDSLDTDGYSHSVEKQRLLLQQLAAAIAQQIK